MAFFSLLVLVVAIIIGIVFDLNIGIISIGVAFLFGTLAGFEKADIVAGFNSSLAITLIGVLMFFSILRENGTLELLARKIANACGSKRWLLYIAMFAIGALLSGLGAGAVPVIALIPVIAIPVALKVGINPLLLSIIGDLGANSCRLSPITPEGQIISSILATQNLDSNTFPSMMGAFLQCVILVAVAFVYFKGWKFEKITVTMEDQDISFDLANVLSLCALFLVILFVVGFHYDMGFVCFVVSGLLMILRCADSQKVILSISWNTVLMVLGVGVLMNMITMCGGIELLAGMLSKVGTARSVTTMLSLVANTMALFASGLGVVFPTLTSTLGEITALVSGLNIHDLVAVIGESANGGFLPVCTAGALICSGVAQFPEMDDIYPQKKLFLQLFLVSGVFYVCNILMAFIGINRIVL